ncbi:hypothetical protein FS837_007068 [Tulasnella sp. UAMH 9824]|nr:hypothetical protein FS837_007068 [Tulasnella sp. UAMH 9824]
MKRIRVVMAKFGTKTKSVAGSPAAAATIIAVCTVVGTIPVPGVQTVCTGISEFIKMMEGAHANEEQWTALLDVMQRYAKRLENFADSVSHNQPDNYLVDSTDKVAVDAREAIEEFTKQITDAKDKIEAKRNEGKIKRHLGASAIKDEIRECRQALADALEDFNGRVHNIIVRSTVKSAEITVKPEPYDIPGASTHHRGLYSTRKKTIQNGDFRIVKDIDYPSRYPNHTFGGDTFWENLRSVDLGDNQNFVAKIYVTKSSKEQFKKDMEFFSDNFSPKSPFKKAGKFLCDQSDNVQQQYIRAIRPFTLALRKDVQKFLEYDTHHFTSPAQVSKALRRLWPDIKDRMMRCDPTVFPAGMTAGDVGVLEVGEDGEIHFRYLTNIADVFGGIRFASPSQPPTDFPYIWRETCYDKIDDPDHRWYRPIINWAYELYEQNVSFAALARQFKIIGERYGVRPSSLAMTRVAFYRADCDDCDPMRDLLQPGHPIHCYISFDPDSHQLQSVRWSFHPQPPSEEEAAAEVSVLESFECPKIWVDPRPFNGPAYWQFEDEDFEFFSGDEEEMARIDDGEEPSGSSSPKA